MKIIINKVYISSYTLALQDDSTIVQFDHCIEELKKFLNEIPIYNSKLVTNDCLDHVMNGKTLDGIFCEIAKYDDAIYTYLLTALNRSTTTYSAKVSTGDALQEAIDANFNNEEFVSFYSQGKTISDLPNNIQIDSLQSLHDLNNENLGNFPISPASFTKRAKLLFNNISYHKDFELTLNTVKNGDFKDYSVVFAKTLKALNFAVPKLSTDKTIDELINVIIDTTSEVYRTLKCTRQGKHKENLFADFVIDGKQFLNLNCEFHLKVNFNNQGLKLDTHYNRAYFGLPMVDTTRRIALFHLGGHL